MQCHFVRKLSLLCVDLKEKIFSRYLTKIIGVVGILFNVLFKMQVSDLQKYLSPIHMSLGNKLFIDNHL